MQELPQADHADLGLVPDSDHTEDLRPNSRTAPDESGVSAPAGTAPTNQEVVTTTTTRKAIP